MLLDQLQSFRMLMLLLAAGTMFSVSMEWWFPFNVVPLPVILLASVAWAAVVWRAEPPSRRGYHRTAPIPVFLHDIIKILAGGLVLSVGVSIVLAVLTVGWIISGIAPYLPISIPLIWLHVLATSLLTYALVSAIPMLTDRPLEWMIAVAATTALLNFLALEYKLMGLRDAMYFLISSNFGVSAALIGPMGHRDWNEGL